MNIDTCMVCGADIIGTDAPANPVCESCLKNAEEDLAKMIVQLANEKICIEPGCWGKIEADRFVFLQRGGCAISNMAFPCTACSRLYRWDETEPILNANGQKVFWEGDLKTGKPVIKGEPK